VSVERSVREELDRSGLSLSEPTIAALSTYANEMVRWNRAVNLTALNGRELVRRLIVEPIWIGRELQISGVLLDVGSGNGSPAIPLALSRSLSQIHLVESRARRAAFLRQIIQQLQLTNCKVHKTRLEDMPQIIGRVEYVTLQAVAPERHVLSALHGLVSPETKIVWITSGQSKPAAQAHHLDVPASNTEIWIFRLDQS